MENLQTFLNQEHQQLLQRYAQLQEKEHILARMVKLSEEVGELSQLVLSYYGLQREEKLTNHGLAQEERKKKLRLAIANEIADVIFAAGLLAKVFDLDIKTTLTGKSKIIQARSNQETRNS